MCCAAQVVQALPLAVMLGAAILGEPIGLSGWLLSLLGSLFESAVLVVPQQAAPEPPGTRYRALGPLASGCSPHPIGTPASSHSS